MWNTEEMLDLVEWMRRFNTSGRGRMRFVGFDMQKPDAAAGIVERFFRGVDPAWADSVDALASAIRSLRQARVGFVTATGRFPAQVAAGHRVRFSGLIRTQQVSGHAGLWWRADAGGTWRALDNMQGQQITGTRGWKRYQIELDIPADTDSISFGMSMSGTGSAWFDSLAIEIDGRPWTDPGRFDLAMESAEGPVGFSRQPGPGYSIAMDDSASVAGRWCLRLSSSKGFIPADAAPRWDAVARSAERVVRRFETEGRRYARAPGSDETEWAARNAHLLLQWSRTGLDRRAGVRDSCMAANLEWILRRSPRGSKIVLWSRNSVVSRAEGTMGDRLAKRFGRDMIVMGFATGEGRFTTSREGRLQADELEPGPEGSIETFARGSRIPRFFLDLRRAGPGSGVATKLATGLTMRSIGAIPPDRGFLPSAISREYDVLAWIEKAQPTRPLERH
jgi:erythromycin esterase-like protein